MGLDSFSFHFLDRHRSNLLPQEKLFKFCCFWCSEQMTWMRTWEKESTWKMNYPGNMVFNFIRDVIHSHLTIIHCGWERNPRDITVEILNPAEYKIPYVILFLPSSFIWQWSLEWDKQGITREGKKMGHHRPRKWQRQRLESQRRGFSIIIIIMTRESRGRIWNPVILSSSITSLLFVLLLASSSRVDASNCNQYWSWLAID